MIKVFVHESVDNYCSQLNNGFTIYKSLIYSVLYPTVFDFFLYILVFSVVPTVTV